MSTTLGPFSTKTVISLTSTGPRIVVKQGSITVIVKVGSARTVLKVVLVKSSGYDILFVRVNECGPMRFRSSVNERSIVFEVVCGAVRDTKVEAVNSTISV